MWLWYGAYPGGQEGTGYYAHPTLIAVPVGTLDDRFKTGDVIVVLDVNRQGIQHGATCKERSMHGCKHGDSMMASKTAHH
jgi:hypothetical protein